MITKELSNDTLSEQPADAASVILIRDYSANHSTDSELQTLLLCRSNSRTVMNNAWVFPGGKVEPADLQNAEATRKLLLPNSASVLLAEPNMQNTAACALFNAACRETLEETSVSIQPDELQTWSRWITPNEPSMMKKRFDARFFIAAMPQGQQATHDGIEATDSQWGTPKQLLVNYTQGQLVLAPPQIMSLIALTDFSSVAQCLHAASLITPHHIRPEVLKTDNTRILTYPGDPEHSEPKKEMPGPTRLIWKETHFEPADGFGSYIE